jgi:hypothetical protein
MPVKRWWRLLHKTGFFDVDDRLKRLSDLGDQLEAFRAAVDFEMFRPELNAALRYSDGSQGGRAASTTIPTSKCCRAAG